MKKNVVVYVDEKTALVTKTFKKNACIFGTDEFKLWREYKAMFPDAVMTTKDIKKNHNKKTRRNLTFANMVEYMKTQENSEDLLAEFETMKSRSKIQASPYQYVLSWFEAKFEGYGGVTSPPPSVTSDPTASSNVRQKSSAMPPSGLWKDLAPKERSIGKMWSA